MLHLLFPKLEFVKSNTAPSRPHRSVDIKRPLISSDTSQDHFKIPFNCLTLDKEIGSGAYGSIYHGVIACEHQTEPVEIAVKVLKSKMLQLRNRVFSQLAKLYCFSNHPEMATSSERRSLKLEIDMLRELDYHRHLVSMLAWCHQGNQLALVMEYIPGGNLQEFLRNHRSKVKTKCESHTRLFEH